MNDLISKASVCEILSDIYPMDGERVVEVEKINKAYDAVLVLPTVEERKKGKWIKDEEQSANHVEPIFICSSCHNYEAWGLTECTRYCPNCGSFNGGEE